jgi:hypothetical protein
MTRWTTRLEWGAAPACAAAPSATTSSRDKANRLWGWENNRCVRRAAVGVAVVLPCTATTVSNQAPLLTRRARIPPSRHPSRHSNCAFKAANGAPVHYPGYIGPRYAEAPAAPPPPPPPPPSPSPAPAQGCGGAGIGKDELAGAIAERLWKKMADATK